MKRLVHLRVYDHHDGKWKTLVLKESVYQKLVVAIKEFCDETPANPQ